MWAIFKICWFVTILLLFCVLVLWLQAYGILAPWPGIEPTSPALKGKVLTTRPPGKFLSPFSKCCSWEHVLVACMSSARPDLCFCSDFPHHNISPNTLFYSYMCNRSLYRDLCWDRYHKRGNGKLIPLLSFCGEENVCCWPNTSLTGSSLTGLICSRMVFLAVRVFIKTLILGLS